MIPIKLVLKNFLSYGNNIQTIDFGSYPLICLSGKNGNGKSGMLDAMTWALWGEARKISGIAKADSGLLRLGQSQMMVSLEFEFNKNIYRVKREFAKAYGKQYANLDFEIFDDVKSSFISLTDKTIRATQEKISNLLGLDFATFVNSAFLRQGNSNEFSQKSPKERKEILTSILGLSRYDQLKVKALEYSKKFSDEKSLIQKLQEHVLGELVKKDIFVKSMQEQNQELETIENNHKRLQVQYVDLENDWLKIKETIKTAEILSDDLNRKKESYNHELFLMQAEFRTWRNLNSQLLSSVEKTLLETEINNLLAQDQKLRDNQQKSLDLQSKILKFKEQFNELFSKKKNELQKDLFENKRKVDLLELEKRNYDKQLDEQNKALRLILGKIEKSEAIIKNLKASKEEFNNFSTYSSKTLAQFEKRKSFYQLWVQRYNWFGSALKELEHKKVSLNDIDDPSCPLCEQVLTIKRKQFLSIKFSKDEVILHRKHKRLSAILTALKQILIEQNDTIKNFKQKEQELSEKVAQFDEHERCLKELINNKITIETEIKNINLHYKVVLVDLENKNLIVKEKEKLIEDLEKNDLQLQGLASEIKLLDQKDKLLNYNSKEHAILKVKIEEIQKKLNLLADFDQIAKEQEIRKSKISSFIRSLKAQKINLSAIVQKIEKINEIKSQEVEIDKKRDNIKKEISALLDQQQKIFQEIGSIKTQLSNLEKIEKDSALKDQQIAFLTKEIDQYQKLAYIFGKDGIQALLIEEAIPEIEQEANTILSKITDNRSQIFIESLRDLKKGGSKETLDIQISDSSGIRPYEMFSGGEAFRIDFALRIAISKLLARRAGTALQTLIIDEGFGSQDDEGLNRLMDAIYAIQKDFAKIIVVSHLPIFKDNFPVHFVVEKLPTGSQVVVVERG